MNDLRDGLSRAGRQAPAPAPDSFDQLTRRRARRARRGRVTAAAVSLAVAAVAIGGAFLAFRPHAPGGGNEKVRSAAGMDLSVGADQFAYQKTVDYSYGPEGDGQGWPLYVDQFTEQTWYRADGAGRDATLDANNFFTPGDRQTYIQQMGHNPPDEAPSDKTYDAGGYPTDTGDLSYLSTDPATLLTQLQDRSAPTGRSPQPEISDSPGQAPAGSLSVWGAIQHLLLFGPNASPALKAALFEVAEQLPGVDVIQGSTDPVGRTGTLLRLQVQGTQAEYWFDPTSEQLLATRSTIETDAFPQYPQGTVTSIDIVTAAGVTDSTDDGAPLVKSFVPAPVTSPPAMPDPRS
jgi:hypothetical protein